MLRLMIYFLLPAVWSAAQPPLRILIAYHSETGNTEKLARAVRVGAAAEGVETIFRRTADVNAAEMIAADGILLGTPVYWGSLSAEAKRFLDRLGTTLHSARPQMGEGRAAAVFCTGGQVSAGKELARIAVLTAFLHMRFVAVGGVEGDGYGNLGAQATTGGRPPNEKELEEARRFGERFVRLTRQLRQTPAPAAR